MRLTVYLFRRNTLPKGHIFRGKDRLVKPVTPLHLRRLKENLDIEEKNMFYLRFPYLTEAQSAGHAKALGKREAYKQKHEDSTRAEFKDDVTLADRLSHLRVKENWD